VSTFFEIKAQTEGESGKGAGRQTASMCVKRYALKTAGLREKVGEIYVIKGGSDRKRCGKIVKDWMGEGVENIGRSV